VLVLRNGFLGLSGAGESIGVLQPDAGVGGVFVEVALQQRHRAPVLLARQERRCIFSLFGHARAILAATIRGQDSI
jgi:hypothetical protein